MGKWSHVVDYTLIYSPQHQQKGKQKASAHYGPHESSAWACPQDMMKYKHWGFSNYSNTNMQLSKLLFIIKNTQKVLMLELNTEIMRSAHETHLFPAL